MESLGLILFLWIVGGAGLAAALLDRSINRTARHRALQPFDQY